MTEQQLLESDLPIVAWMCHGCGASWPADARPERCPKCSGHAFEPVRNDRPLPTAGGGPDLADDDDDEDELMADGARRSLSRSASKGMVRFDVTHNARRDKPAITVQHPGKCRVPGCRYDAVDSGLCGPHLEREQRRRQQRQPQQQPSQQPGGRIFRPEPETSPPQTVKEKTVNETTKKTCRVPNCDRPAKQRGLCDKHWYQAFRGKDATVAAEVAAYALPSTRPWKTAQMTDGKPATPEQPAKVRRPRATHTVVAISTPTIDVSRLDLATLEKLVGLVKQRDAIEREIAALLTAGS